MGHQIRTMLLEDISKLGFWSKVKADPSFPVVRDFPPDQSLRWVATRGHTEVRPQGRGKGPAALPKLGTNVEVGLINFFERASRPFV